MKTHFSFHINTGPYRLHWLFCLTFATLDICPDSCQAKFAWQWVFFAAHSCVTAGAAEALLFLYHSFLFGSKYTHMATQRWGKHGSMLCLICLILFFFDSGEI